LRIKEEVNRELPRTHKGFRCQYEQDSVFRALDRAFLRVVTQPKASSPEANEIPGALRFLARWYGHDRGFPGANHAQIVSALLEGAEAVDLLEARLVELAGTGDPKREAQISRAHELLRKYAASDSTANLPDDVATFILESSVTAAPRPISPKGGPYSDAELSSALHSLRQQLEQTAPNTLSTWLGWLDEASRRLATGPAQMQDSEAVRGDLDDRAKFERYIQTERAQNSRARRKDGYPEPAIQEDGQPRAALETTGDARSVETAALPIGEGDILQRIRDAVGPELFDMQSGRT